MRCPRRHESLRPGFRRQQKFLQPGTRSHPPPLFDRNQHGRFHAAPRHDLGAFPEARFKERSEPGLCLMLMPHHAFFRLFFLDFFSIFSIFCFIADIIDFILRTGLFPLALTRNAFSNFRTHLFMDLEAAAAWIFDSDFIGRSPIACFTIWNDIPRIARMSIRRTGGVRQHRWPRSVEGAERDIGRRRGATLAGNAAAAPGELPYRSAVARTAAARVPCHAAPPLCRSPPRGGQRGPSPVH